MGFSGELWVLFVFVLVFFGFIWFLMWVQPILGNWLEISWGSLGCASPIYGNDLGFSGN